MRPVEDILDEMEQIPYQGLMLAEDNFYGYSKEANAHARALFKGMIDRGIQKTWFGFTQFSTGLDQEALEYMARSGGIGMLIGIETTDAKILRKLRKGPTTPAHVPSQVGATPASALPCRRDRAAAAGY